MLLIFYKYGEVNSLSQELMKDKAEYLNEIETTKNVLKVVMNDKIILKDEQKTLKGTIDALEKEKEVLNNIIQELITIDAASIEWLKYSGISDYTQISEDLRLHPELIPYDGVLGGTMAFTNIYVLNDKWIYARFEDGHIQGYGIYEYTVDQFMNISWKIIDSVLDGNEN
jgi:hypothetical protein